MDTDPLEGLDPKDLLEGALGKTGSGPTPADLEEEREVRAEIQRLLPDLELVSLLGRGGMGYVYEVEQTRLGRRAALKVLAPRFQEEHNLAERFEREARALARLTHPHIVSVYDFGREGNLCWLLMEKVEGTNLRNLIDGGDLTPALSLTIVPPLCEALQYAHDQGVVHRDVKPENILVDTAGNVKIADFGLAKLVGNEVALVTLTGSQQVLGTLRYMAPEQLDRPLEVDHRADIYSLGVVFYEMLTGEIPMGRFDPPSARSKADPRLDEVVLRTLEREPGRRYQHVSEVKLDVESCGDEKPRAKGGSPQLSRLSVVSPLLLLLAIPAIFLAFAYFDDEYKTDLGAARLLGEKMEVMEEQLTRIPQKIEVDGPTRSLVNPTWEVLDVSRESSQRELDRIEREETDSPYFDELMEAQRIRVEAAIEEQAKTPQFVEVSGPLNPEWESTRETMRANLKQLETLTPNHRLHHPTSVELRDAQERLSALPMTLPGELRDNPEYYGLVQRLSTLRAAKDAAIYDQLERDQARRVRFFVTSAAILLLLAIAACITGWMGLHRIRLAWPQLYGINGAMIGAWFLPVVAGGAVSCSTLLLGVDAIAGDAPVAFAVSVICFHLGIAVLFLVWWRGRFLAEIQGTKGV